MNEMLARVQTSVERQQRFVADASHELRSPLTRVRTELEVDLNHPDHDFIAGADHVFRVFDEFIAQLGKVNQTILMHADVNEGTKISDVGYNSGTEHSRF